MHLLAAGFQLAQPTFVKYLTLFIKNGDEPAAHGFAYAVGLVLSALGNTLCIGQMFYQVRALVRV